MAIETVKSKEQGIDIGFPKLMIHKDDLRRDDPLIVLFTSESNGIALSCNYTDDDQDIGVNVATWCNINNFMPYQGDFTIRNKGGE